MIILLVGTVIIVALAFSILPSIVGLLLSRTYCLFKRRSK
jgi:hypothetical protein